MRHGCIQYRRRIGEAGGFQQYAVERAASVVEVAQQCFQRVDKVPAHGAAQAARLQQQQVVANIFDEQVVKRDLAELIYDDGSVGEGRLFKQMVEQGGLAGAEEARERR